MNQQIEIEEIESNGFNQIIAIKGSAILQIQKLKNGMRFINAQINRGDYIEDVETSHPTMKELFIAIHNYRNAKPQLKLFS
jgi:hypothetical protein